MSADAADARWQRMNAGGEGWIRIADIGDRALMLTTDQRIQLLAVALTELAVYQALVMVHGSEHGARRFAEAGGHVRFRDDGEPVISLAAAEMKGKRS
jgi:hypothetical protein